MAFKWFIGQNQSILTKKQVFNDFGGGYSKQRSDNRADCAQWQNIAALHQTDLKGVWEQVLRAMISFHVHFNSLSFSVSGA